MFRLILLWLLACLPPLAGAQALFEDSMAQRMLACTLCHGKQGRAAPDGYYPRIAGKPAGYLYQQLLNFRDGRRHYGPMRELLVPLSDAYLQEIAQHFAQLELPYAAAQPAALPAQDLARGQALVRQGDASRGLPACSACHGEAMLGAQPRIPGLLGLPRDYLNGQLGAWRAGLRRASAPDCMAEIAQRLRPEEINAISHWLAAQTVPAGAKPAPGPTLPLPMRCGGLP
jgi:cytochrome c553